MKNHLKDLLVGFAIGTANIIPGVSGGTFLLIFGIYEKTIAILNRFNGDTLKELFTALIDMVKQPKSSEQRSLFISACTKYEIPFLIKLIGGAGIAIVALSSLLKMLLANYQTPTFGLFFGLILASVVVPFKQFKKLKPIHLLPFLAGTAITVAVSTGVNPVNKLEVKSANYEARLESGEESVSSNYTAMEYTLAAVAGAVAISAMVLPGISGSLVLLLLGQYGAVLTAISAAKSLQFDAILFLGIFSLGMAVGLLLFVRLVNWVFAKWHDGTVATLAGLIAGSLYALWPFKTTVTMSYYGKIDDVITYLENVDVFTNQNCLPSGGIETIVTVALIVVGVMIMVPFIKHEK